MANTQDKPAASGREHEGAGLGKDGAKTDDRARPENAKGKTDERLDDALEETFPSSDPVSVKITK